MDHPGRRGYERPGGEAAASGRGSIWRMTGWVAGVLGLIYGGYEVLERTWLGAAGRVGASMDRSSGARGRMPLFSYLTEDEIGAPYLYLVLYPPREG